MTKCEPSIISYASLMPNEKKMKAAERLRYKTFSLNNLAKSYDIAAEARRRTGRTVSDGLILTY